MTYKTRTVRCSKAGLTQEQALESLYDHPDFDSGAMQVMGIRQAGNHWVAKLRIAEFPPVDDDGDDDDAPVPAPKESPKPKPKGDSDGDNDGDEGPDPIAPSDDDGDEDDAPPFGKPKDKPEGGEKPGGGELGQVLQLLHEIASKLGVGGAPGLPGSEDPHAPGPGGPPGPAGGPPKPPMPPHGGPGGPPPGGPPAGGPPPGRSPLPLRPGQIPPGVTPINTPSFASVVGTAPSFTADEVTDMPIKQAKAELEALYGESGSELPQGARPYRVAQIKESRNSQGKRVVAALLTVR